MDIDWETLEEFPDYAISTHGHVVNMKRGGSDVRTSPNQYGHIRVGLVKDRVQHTRSLAQLVAQTFLDPPKEEHFNTPIHLDGDLYNCRADNLMWRPRAFAIRYHKQFDSNTFLDPQPIKLEELDTGTVYESVKEACIENGLYWFDVTKSYIEETFTPITFQHFRRVY